MPVLLALFPLLFLLLLQLTSKEQMERRRNDAAAMVAIEAVAAAAAEAAAQVEPVRLHSPTAPCAKSPMKERGMVYVSFLSSVRPVTTLCVCRVGIGCCLVWRANAHSANAQSKRLVADLCHLLCRRLLPATMK